jgi:hypothetical protein
MFGCVLPDKFVAGCMISKMLETWIDFRKWCPYNTPLDCLQQYDAKQETYLWYGSWWKKKVRYLKAAFSNNPRKMHGSIQFDWCDRARHSMHRDPYLGSASGAT